jgi:putative tricarboxylic transport membrane protein
MVIDPERSLPDEPEVVPTGWQRWSELLIAAAVIALGIVVLVQTQDIRITRAVARVSPRAIPQIVGAGLIVLGVWYAIDIVRKPHAIGGGEDSEDVDIDAPTDWVVIAIIAVGLALFAALVKPAGFAIASAALFATSAFAMGSRRIILDLVIGLALGVAIFLVFDTWLGVRLPEGWLGGVLP